MDTTDYLNQIKTKIKDALLIASTTYRNDQKHIYRNCCHSESIPRAKWVLENLLKNAETAEHQLSPLCDDTGIPHIMIELGKNKTLTGEMLQSIYEGINQGLRELPGRPMAIKGSDFERLDQSGGLDEDPAAVVPAPFVIKQTEEDVIRVHILMQGGGPEIRGRTHSVFHKHSLEVIWDEVISWIKEEAAKLGCTPCIPSIGIGRTHFEASSLMLQAMFEGNLESQSKIEKMITQRVNDSQIGPLGLKGNTTALGTFIKVGPQRASGVRIVSLRLACCVEPRRAAIEI